jgi:hypothetical protein
VIVQHDCPTAMPDIADEGRNFVNVPRFASGFSLLFALLLAGDSYAKTPDIEAARG